MKENEYRNIIISWGEMITDSNNLFNKGQRCASMNKMRELEDSILKLCHKLIVSKGKYDYKYCHDILNSGKWNRKTCGNCKFLDKCWNLVLPFD
jgi:hypothetical protein